MTFNFDYTDRDNGNRRESRDGIVIPSTFPLTRER